MQVQISLENWRKVARQNSWGYSSKVNTFTGTLHNIEVIEGIDNIKQVIDEHKNFMTMKYHHDSRSLPVISEGTVDVFIYTGLKYIWKCYSIAQFPVFWDGNIWKLIGANAPEGVEDFGLFSALREMQKATISVDFAAVLDVLTDAIGFCISRDVYGNGVEAEPVIEVN